MGTSRTDSNYQIDIGPGNVIPHDKYNILGIAHERTNRKDNIFMQIRLYNDEAHTALDIFRFAVFFSIHFIQFKAIGSLTQ